MTRRIVIVYGTRFGQTAKVPRYIELQLTKPGHRITLARADALPPGLTPNDFDCVIVGASVTYGRHQRSVERFVRAHRDVLNAMPAAFFSVIGAAASRDAAGRTRARRYVDEFLRATGWRPELATTVAGAMAYTKYSPLLRWLTRRTSAKEGGPTDTSRDHEFTDWAEVRRFAEPVAATVRPRRASPLAAMA